MWNKKGIFIKPDPSLWWCQTHAMLPTVRHVEENLYDIFYSGRDKKNVSHIGVSRIEINSDGHLNELYKFSDPVLSIGERGCFDDNGVTPSCFINNSIYYIGWNSGTSTYRMSLIMGLAKCSKTQYDFERVSRAPLLQKTNLEPFGICTAPCVIIEESLYRMWYVSGEGWLDKDTPLYNIKYCESKDGIDWKRDGVVSLKLLENETALARPWVIKTNNQYEMYFSYKDPNVGYRIGYATSSDGVSFVRQDNSYGLDVSDSGWDSEMVEYSCVFDYNNTRYMLYNGNNYGIAGIGYAIWS